VSNERPVHLIGAEPAANADGSRPGAAAFARAWAKAIAGTSYLPMAETEIESFLITMTRRLEAALYAEPFSLGTGYEIGADLVAAHVTSAEALGRTIEVIDGRLLRDLGLADDDLRDRMARLLGTVATGFARALRDRTLDEQEAVRRAAMVARAQAERKLRDSESRFRHQATHDPLTGLPNRALFTERLNTVFAEAALADTALTQAEAEADRANAAADISVAGSPVEPRRLGVCFVDLDGFKVVNDTLGHHVGDQLLAAVARRLGHSVNNHLVARMGGDEFVILVEDTTCTDDALKVADAALLGLTEPIHVDGHELTVSASIGIVERPVVGTSPSEVMQAADITLHWAKTSGKNRCALFDPERMEHELTQYALAAAMPAGLDRGEFFLDYQPLVSLSDNALVGVEALVRWRHPEFGVLPPNRFIGMAEETGLIVRLGIRALARACQQAQEWQGLSSHAPFVSVNLAVRQVHDPGLVDDVLAILDRTGLPPHRLQLEITESAVMSKADEPVHALRALADRGVRIAIDDFGTGYSNLAYLRDLPVCELKVAGSFVEGLRAPMLGPESVTDERILATLVSLAHMLGLTVTAEGVETADQADRLRAIGCDSAQGWHFGRPVPADEIAAMIRTPG
jgi:diguanylate cyclase (GGDEF)-like protein